MKPATSRITLYGSHDLAERQQACVDGLCPICLQQEVIALRAQLNAAPQVSLHSKPSDGAGEAQTAGGPASAAPVHKDHPLRHFDRTCSGCMEEAEMMAQQHRNSPAPDSEMPDTNDKKYQHHFMQYVRDLSAYALALRELNAFLRSQLAEAKKQRDLYAEYAGSSPHSVIQKVLDELGPQSLIPTAELKALRALLAEKQAQILRIRSNVERENYT